MVRVRVWVWVRVRVRVRVRLMGFRSSLLYEAVIGIVSG